MKLTGRQGMSCCGALWTLFAALDTASAASGHDALLLHCRLIMGKGIDQGLQVAPSLMGIVPPAAERCTVESHGCGSLPASRPALGA